MEADLVTSEKFYEAGTQLFREGPRRWRTLFNDNSGETANAADEIPTKKGAAASSKPGEMIADQLWIILGTLKGIEPTETCIGNGLYGLIHMGISQAGAFKAPASMKCDHGLGNRMETLAWFFAMGDAHHQLFLIRYILELHFLYEE